MNELRRFSWYIADVAWRVGRQTVLENTMKLARLDSRGVHEAD
jgi:hypothetical protein